MSAIPAVVFSLGFLLGQSSVGHAADFTGPQQFSVQIGIPKQFIDQVHPV